MCYQKRIDTLKEKKNGYNYLSEENLDGVLNKTMKETELETAVVDSKIELKALHDMHHFRQDRTLFLAKRVEPSITKKAVKERCSKFQSRNLTPIRHIVGELQVEKNWDNLAIDREYTCQ